MNSRTIKTAGHWANTRTWMKLVGSWLAGAFALIGSAVTAHGNIAVIWSGPLLTYQQPNPDPTQATNQDRITPSVWITRGLTQGLFNAKTETNFTHFLSPAGTEWADGELTNYASLAYCDWDTWAKKLHESPLNTVGVNAVLHLVNGNIYIGIQFTQWDQVGGGFAYRRTTPPLPQSIPLQITPLADGLVLSWNNAAFRLQTATNSTGPFAPVIGATSPFTNSFSDFPRFFRLVH